MRSPVAYRNALMLAVQVFAVGILAACNKADDSPNKTEALAAELAKVNAENVKLKESLAQAAPPAAMTSPAVTKTAPRPAADPARDPLDGQLSVTLVRVYQHYSYVGYEFEMVNRSQRHIDLTLFHLTLKNQHGGYLAGTNGVSFDNVPPGRIGREDTFGAKNTNVRDVGSFEVSLSRLTVEGHDRYFRGNPLPGWQDPAIALASRVPGIDVRLAAP